MVLLYSWKFLPSSIHSHWYFEVTWQLTMKLFQAKISEWAALQNLWCQRVTVYCYPRKCWLMTTVAASLMNFQVQNFQLYNKSLKDWCQGKKLIFFPLNFNVSLGLPSETLRFLGDKIHSLPLRPVVDCSLLTGL